VSCRSFAPSAPCLFSTLPSTHHVEPPPPPLLHCRSYSQALAECPSCPAEVRLGLAACYFRAGEVGRATAAYERVLELNPNCVQAMLGLAVLKLTVDATSAVSVHMVGGGEPCVVLAHLWQVTST
jgi:hypothetical protein